MDHHSERDKRVHRIRCCMRRRRHITTIYTERQIKVCTWLREISSCSCLTALSGPAWVLLSKTCTPLFAPLYKIIEYRRVRRFLESQSGNLRRRCDDHATSPTSRLSRSVEERGICWRRRCSLYRNDGDRFARTVADQRNRCRPHYLGFDPLVKAPPI